MTPFALTTLRSPADPAFAALLDLYRSSFPPEEQKSPEALAAMLGNPIYTVLVAHPPSTLHPVALAITASPRSSSIVLLEYLAVAPARQGQGLGRSLFTHLTAAANQQQRPLLLEVETDPTPQAASDSPQARRRRFYRSLGARKLSGLQYRMPAVSGGEPPPMHLFLHAPDSPTTISRPTLHTWLTALYTEVYSQPADDPRIAAMLDPLPDHVPLV